MINGVTKIVMTKADILDDLKELKVCNGYLINGEEKNYVPFQMSRVKIEPVYKSFEGWQTDVTQTRDFKDMPAQMKTYIDYLNNYLKVPIRYISNGPGREQIVMADM
jgi:adenylosuccinate synthase